MCWSMTVNKITREAKKRNKTPVLRGTVVIKLLIACLSKILPEFLAEA